MIPESVPLFEINDKGQWHIPEPSAAELRQAGLFLGTPCGNCQMTVGHAESCEALFRLLDKLGVRWQKSRLGNESCIVRGRNTLAAEFMMSGLGFLFTPDADIGFDPRVVVKKMSLNLNFVAGCVPVKGVFFENAVKYVQLLRDAGQLDSLTPERLEHAALQYVFTPVTGREPLRRGPATEVELIGNAFTLVKRNVFDQMIAGLTVAKLTNPLFAELLPWYWNFYENSWPGGDFQTEDYTMCRRWRALGGAVYAYAEARLTHTGMWNFKGQGVTL